MDILADARALLQTVDGISRYSLNMIRSISALRPDWSISVFVPRKAAYHLKGVQVLNVIEDTPRFSLNERIQLAPLIDSLKPDVYVNFSMAGPCPRAPSIVTVHDLMVLNIPDYFDNTLLKNYLSRSLFKILVSRSVRHAERIAVPSEATRSEVSQTYRRTRDKIFITGEGQNLFECSGTGPSERKNFLLYVGNARSYKNLPRLLTAYKGILKDDSNFPELVMVIRKDRAYDGFISLFVGKGHVPPARGSAQGPVQDVQGIADAIHPGGLRSSGTGGHGYGHTGSNLAGYRTGGTGWPSHRPDVRR